MFGLPELKMRAQHLSDTELDQIINPDNPAVRELVEMHQAALEEKSRREEELERERRAQLEAEAREANDPGKDPSLEWRKEFVERHWPEMLREVRASGNRHSKSFMAFLACMKALILHGENGWKQAVLILAKAPARDSRGNEGKAGALLEFAELRHDMWERSRKLDELLPMMEGKPSQPIA